MKKIVAILSCLLLVVIIGMQTGCWNKGHNPAAIETSMAPGPVTPQLAKSVSFGFLPPKRPNPNFPRSAVLTAADSFVATGVFKLILVNVNNPSTPFTLISKTAPIVNGVATVSFESVPAQTCIGDVHIEGGNMYGYADWHRVVDLKADAANEMSVAPKESRMKEDVETVVVGRVASTTYLYSKVVPGMAQIASDVVAELNNLEAPTVYEDAVSAYVNKSIKPVQAGDIVFAPSAVLIDADSLNTLSAIENNGFRFIFTNPTASLTALTPGNIMVGGANEIASAGILRKITAVTNDGANLVLETTTAALEEAIQSCSIEYYGNLKTRPILARKTIRPYIIEGETGGTIVYNQSILMKGLTLDADFTINSKFYFKLDIQYFKVREFVSTFDVSEEARLTLTSNAAIDFTETYETPPSLLAILELGPVVVPVYWNLVFTASAKADIGLKMTLGQSMKATIGARMYNDQWEPVKSFQNEIIKEWELSPEANLSIGFGPKLDARIYGLAGPTLTVKANGYLDLYPEKQLSVDLSAEFGAKVEVSSFLKIEKRFGPFNTARRVLWRGTGPSSEISKIKIYRPGNSDQFTAGADIPIVTRGVSTQGKIAKIEFFQNGIKLNYDAEDLTYPFEYTWRNVPAGTYALTTKALDSLGATADSPPITITVISPQPDLTQFPDPVITSISPNPVPALGKDQQIAISGRNFRPGIKLRLRKPNFNVDKYLAVTPISGTQISAFINVGEDPNAWTIQAYNEDGTLSDQFRFETIPQNTNIPIADGFDYPIGANTYYTKTYGDDGWYSAQNFGVWNDEYNGYHLGEDWNAETGESNDLGSPVYSAAKGIVLLASQTGKLKWGKVMVVRHKLADGTLVETLYGHLQSMLKKVGDTVSRRENIATIGDAEGFFRNAAHLHFEVRFKNVGANNWGLPGPGYAATDKPPGWQPPSDFMDSHRPVGSVNRPPSISVDAPTNVAAVPGDGKNTISWNPVSGAGSYNIYWSTSSGVSKSGNKIAGVSNPFPHTGRTNGTRYYYVVTAVSGATESAVSNQTSVIPVAAMVSGPPTVFSPGTHSNTGSRVSNLTPTFLWSAVPGASRYGFSISKEPWGTPYIVHSNKNVPGTSYPIPSGILEYGITYRWDVTAFVNGVESNPSKDLYFSTPGGSPILSGPGTMNKGAYYPVESLTPTLYWGKVPGATGYKLYVTKAPFGWDSNPSTRVWSNENLPDSQTSVTIPSSKLAKKTSYAWSVTSVVNGVESGHSKARYFTTL